MYNPDNYLDLYLLLLIFPMLLADIQDTIGSRHRFLTLRVETYIYSSCPLYFFTFIILQTIHLQNNLLTNLKIKI